MGNKLTNDTFKALILGATIFIVPAMAEDIFIDCANGAPQCAMLGGPRGLYSPSTDPAVQAAPAPGYSMDGKNGPIPVTPQLGVSQPVEQIVIRDTAAPIALSKPIDEMEEVGSEYNVYNTSNGSLIVEREVSNNTDEYGNTIQLSRSKETEITPRYVEMPSISASALKSKVAYGDSVHDWEALSGESLRALLIEWGQKSGWTVVWKLDRDYILEAGVIFRGNFTEVASAIIRTFARANPAPIGTFYKGNRVLVINTQEDDNA